MATPTNSSSGAANNQMHVLNELPLFGMSVDFNLSSINQFLNNLGGDAGAAGGGMIGKSPLFDLPFVREVCAQPTGNRSSTIDVTDVQNVYTQLRIILDIYVVIGLCLIGFIGNALAIAVLRRDQINTTSWLLQTLAVVDIAYLIACLFIQSLRTINDSTEWMLTLRSTVPRVEPYLWMAASTAQTVTVWTVLLLTVDRYVAVCSPFDPGLRSLRRARISVCVVLGVAIAYNAPLLAEREAVEVTDLCTGEKRWRSRKTEAFNDLYVYAYKTVMYFVFRTVGPLVALLVLNTRLIVALNRSRRRRKHMAVGIGSGNRAMVAVGPTAAVAGVAAGAVVKSKPSGGGGGGGHRENITLMLVVVVSVFIVCQLPDLGLRIAGTQV